MYYHVSWHLNNSLARSLIFPSHSLSVFQDLGGRRRIKTTRSLRCGRCSPNSRTIGTILRTSDRTRHPYARSPYTPVRTRDLPRTCYRDCWVRVTTLSTRDLCTRNTDCMDYTGLYIKYRHYFLELSPEYNTFSNWRRSSPRTVLENKLAVGWTLIRYVDVELLYRWIMPYHLWSTVCGSQGWCIGTNFADIWCSMKMVVLPIDGLKFDNKINDIITIYINSLFMKWNR